MTNSIGMTLALIPPGEFQMGSPDGEGEPDEHPRRAVRLTRAFWMATTPVTVAQWHAVIGGRRPEPLSLEMPAEGMSWTQAAAFAERLSDLPAEREAARRYRLPTEAEWEYACRAGSSAAFAFGDRLPEDRARFGGYGRGPGPVGSFPPNAFGLFDMHGNVWEWCADWYEPDYYRRAPAEDPPGPGTGVVRVLRGGCWLSGPFDCGSASRGSGAPDRRTDWVGFRVVCGA
jgi:formylglycine-generating enzyme required for sulfatase activity